MPAPADDRTESIFSGALIRPPELRDAYVATACGGDTALLAEVRALLAAHDAAPTGFLDGPAGGGIADEEPEDLDATFKIDPSTDPQTTGGWVHHAIPTEQEGDHIGPYKLLQQLGEGGFGTVWMAEQSEPISRMVALKVIKAGMDTREVLARFEAERQAVALMDHPNIAKILDAGATSTGRPFFVMELVKGIPITRFCDEQSLGTKQRLALFGDVCSAINHAHQKGVIHRDIKPNNVMVTLHGDRPVVKVIDFGIAKATQGKLTDRTLFTKFDQFVGTPVYMSPEQASLSGLDIDTRSDIYALGVLLYELLVGKPPFDGKSLLSAGYEEMRRIIREVEPPKPSSRLSTVAGRERTQLAKARRIEPDKLARLVEPDLDWIIMKAIEKDRARRYETANAFAQDIVRFLADEPVTATPPSAGYQFRKFAKRHKVALRVASAMAVVLVVATFVSTWQAVRATRAETLTAQEAARTRAALEDAEAVSQFLTDMFERTRPGEEKGGREVKVVDVLDPAMASLAANETMPPARRAKLQATLGSTYHALGLSRQAIDLQQKARDYHLASSGPEHPDTLMAMHNLAISYGDAGRRDEALTLEEEVLELRRKVLGPEHPDTLKAMNNLAGSYRDAGRRDEALEMFEELLPLLRKMLGTEHPVTLAVMSNLAISYFETGRRDEGLKMSEEVLPLRRKVSGAEHPDTLWATNNLASIYQSSGRLDESLPLQEELLQLSLKVLGPEHPETVGAMHNLAMSYHAADRLEEALTVREEVLELQRRGLGPEHPDTLSAMHNLATSYHAAGRLDEALALREDLLEFKRRVLGPEHPDTLVAISSLAISYCEAGRRDEALTLRKNVLVLKRRALGAEHPETFGAMQNLAMSYHYAGRLDEALPLSEEAMDLYGKVLGTEHPNTITAMSNLASFYHEAGRREQAITLMEEVLELRRKVLGPEHPSTVKAIQVLVHLYETSGQIAAAIPLLAEASTLDPADTSLALKTAALQSWFDRGADHAITSSKALEWAKGATKADDLERSAKLACLRPISDAATQDAALALARKAVELGAGDETVLPWAQMTLGMAEFRAGHLEQAVQTLSSHPTTAGHIGGTSAFYRAMSLFHLDRKDEARALLTEAEAKMKPFPADDTDPLAGANASADDLILWLACREAKALLEATGDPTL